MSTDPTFLTGWDRVIYGAIGGAVGALIGVGLTEFKNWWFRKRKHQAYWSALRAEVEFAAGRAQTLRSDHVMAPLYRLPSMSFERCYPELLADGALSEEDGVSLLAFYTEVEALNRGLDQAANAEDEARVKVEFQRNLLKAEGLLRDGPLYKSVANAIAKGRK